MVDDGDGTPRFFFTVRNCDGSRKSQQIYYMESSNKGLAWSDPVGLSGPVTIDGQAITGGFSLSDVSW